jgi:hypothetical protein
VHAEANFDDETGTAQQGLQIEASMGKMTQGEAKRWFGKFV